MIDKKSLKMNRLALLLFSVLTLICETTTSVKAQSSDKKMEDFHFSYLQRYRCSQRHAGYVYFFSGKI